MRWPKKLHLRKDNCLDKFFVGQWAPESSFIKKKDTITAFGSCFAGNISKYLAGRGYNVVGHNLKHANMDLIRFDEIMVHTFSMLRQFEWAFEDKPLESGVFETTEEDKDKFNISLNKQLKKSVKNTDIFILTFGLSEVWYHKESGEVLWKFIPNSERDPKKYGFRLSTYEENYENIDKIYQLIRKHRPDAKIIMTLSPIPLLGTYREIPCTSANTVSKAILRVAIDSVKNKYQKDKSFYYWPSYEIVQNYFEDAWEVDNRHVKAEHLRTIMQTFERYYCADSEPERDDDITNRIKAKNKGINDEVVSKIPNFFIIGAAKCATTSIASILGKHPEIAMSAPKEPKYFSINYNKSLKWYVSNMPDDAGTKKARGEASTNYTATHTPESALVPERIHELLPNAKLIYITRNPMDRVVSQWKHVKDRKPKKVPDFNKSINDEDYFKMLVEPSLYMTRIDAYRKYFPDNQILCITYEDFVSDKIATLKKIYNFLEVDPLFIAPNIEVVKNAASDKARQIKTPRWNKGTNKKVSSFLKSDIKKFLSYIGKPSDYWDLSYKRPDEENAPKKEIKESKE